MYSKTETFPWCEFICAHRSPPAKRSSEGDPPVLPTKVQKWYYKTENVSLVCVHMRTQIPSFHIERLLRPVVGYLFRAFPGVNHTCIKRLCNRGGREFESRSSPRNRIFLPFFWPPRTRKLEGNSLIQFGARLIRKWTSYGDFHFSEMVVSGICQTLRSAIAKPPISPTQLS